MSKMRFVSDKSLDNGRCDQCWDRIVSQKAEDDLVMEVEGDSKKCYSAVAGADCARVSVLLHLQGRLAGLEGAGAVAGVFLGRYTRCYLGTTTTNSVTQVST